MGQPVVDGKINEMPVARERVESLTLDRMLITWKPCTLNAKQPS
ncbi:MAG: hypothetical protein ACYDBJ_14145 [Aggregatilineales bacterium]